MGININNLNNTSMMKLFCQRKFFEIKFLPLIGILFFIALVFNYNEINGQVLTKSDTSNVHFLNSRKFFVYKVDKGETYSASLKNLIYRRKKSCNSTMILKKPDLRLK